MARSSWRILLVDDDEEDYLLTREKLAQAQGRKILLEWASSYETALKQINADQFDAILVDYDLGARSGIELIREMSDRNYSPPAILLTGHGSYEVDVEAMQAGATLYLTKSEANALLLERTIRYAIEREQAEEALRISEERFNKAFNATPSALVISRQEDGLIQVINDSFERLFGYAREEVIGKTSLELSLFANPADRQEAIRRLRKDKAVREFELDIRTKSGEIRQASLWVEMITVDREAMMLTIIQDITDRKQAENALRARNEEIKTMTQQLWQTAKLATMGELAASVAHELNNPLAILSLRGELLASKIPESSPERGDLAIMEQEIDRMAALVSNLLQFSRPGERQISSLDIRDEIDRTLELMHNHLIQRNISILREFSPEIPMVQADRQQMRQLFLNLFSNASDAMHQGGTLTVRTRPGGEKSQAVIEIQDTGSGIPAEDLPRIMEPFFSTKPEGKGTGLGLAICRRIVEEHQGSIQISSPGKNQGTTVQITLPGANRVKPIFMIEDEEA